MTSRLKMPFHIIYNSGYPPYPQTIGVRYINCHPFQQSFVHPENLLVFPLCQPEMNEIEPPRELNNRNINNNNRQQRMRTVSSVTKTSSTNSKRNHLPEWALDENNKLSDNVTVEDVLDNNCLVDFVNEKSGCQFLQEKLDVILKNEHLKKRVVQMVIAEREPFLKMCKNVFGNYFVQRVLNELSQFDMMRVIEYMTGQLQELCVDRFACRVVQKLIEMPEAISKPIAYMLMERSNFLDICNNQSGNHVLQKLIKETALPYWQELVHQLSNASDKKFLDLGLGRYGCRVIQAVISELGNRTRNLEKPEDKKRALMMVMNKIITCCKPLSCNEHGNYLIQFVLQSKDTDLDHYRDEIIEKCLCRNLLSLSQEKYSSHVVECALANAPINLLAIMLDEIFDGYVPDPDSGKDAVDILMFHQYGNYVFQTVLTSCCKNRGFYTYCSMTRQEKPIFKLWLKRIQQRVYKEKIRLDRFSSGKKIINIMKEFEDWGPVTTVSSVRGSYRSDSTSADESVH